MEDILSVIQFFARFLQARQGVMHMDKLPMFIIQPLYWLAAP
jgi:hypothetical protein